MFCIVMLSMGPKDLVVPERRESTHIPWPQVISDCRIKPIAGQNLDRRGLEFPVLESEETMRRERKVGLENVGGLR